MSDERFTGICVSASMVTVILALIGSILAYNIYAAGQATIQGHDRTARYTACVGKAANFAEVSICAKDLAAHSIAS